jgi:hypothetical protein
MKKSMLYAGLMAILSAKAFAEPQTHLAQGPQLASASSTTTTPVTPPPATTTTTTTTTTPPPAQGATTPPAQGTTPPPAQEATTPPPAASQPASAQPLNCKYRIPATTTHIEQTIVVKWGEKAAEQSFNFDFKSFDQQLVDLKPCYTEQGWEGFNDALEKSGNINAIKSQQLTVSAMVTGETKISDIKDNQWKLTVPLQVVYQNDKQKLTQPLTINLVVGRKLSGDLGIMQMIAVPNTTTPPKP